MEDERSVVQFLGIKPSKALRSSVVRQVRKWMTREVGLLTSLERDSFEVLVEREGDLAFSCCVRVRSGENCWENEGSGKTVQDALRQTLKHMRAPLSLEARGAPQASLASQGAFPRLEEMSA
jgi:hypothetical protein